jgi:hypothetical protein
MFKDVTWAVGDLLEVIAGRLGGEKDQRPGWQVR